MDCLWVLGLCLTSFTMCINDLEVEKGYLVMEVLPQVSLTRLHLSGNDLGKEDKREYLEDLKKKKNYLQHERFRIEIKKKFLMVKTTTDITEQKLITDSVDFSL